MRRVIQPLVFVVLFSLIAFVACSDTTDKDPPDAGTPDVGQKLDTGDTPDQAVADMAAPDGSSPDAAAPDITVKPDAPPVSKYWKTESYKPTNELLDVKGVSTNEVWAVGKKGTILKYNGTSWVAQTNADTSKSDLYSLVLWPAQKQYYALGTMMYLRNSGTSSSWTKGYSYTTSYYYNFHDGWGLPNQYIYGVGPMSSGSYYYMSYKRNTSTYFSSIYFYSYGPVKTEMHGIWGPSTGKPIVAVGHKGSIVSCSSGTSSCTSYGNWKAMTSGTENHLYDIYGFSSTEMYAVGNTGTVLKYDGSTWTKMVTNTYTYFKGIWGTSGTNLYAVGHPYFKSDESIFHYDGKAWKKMPPAGVIYANAVWGTSSSNVFVVGRTKILKATGTLP